MLEVADRTTCATETSFAAVTSASECHPFRAELLEEVLGKTSIQVMSFVKASTLVKRLKQRGCTTLQHNCSFPFKKTLRASAAGPGQGWRVTHGPISVFSLPNSPSPFFALSIKTTYSNHRHCPPLLKQQSDNRGVGDSEACVEMRP